MVSLALVGLASAVEVSLGPEWVPNSLWRRHVGASIGGAWQVDDVLSFHGRVTWYPEFEDQITPLHRVLMNEFHVTMVSTRLIRRTQTSVRFTPFQITGEGFRGGVGLQVGAGLVQTESGEEGFYVWGMAADMVEWHVTAHYGMTLDVRGDGRFGGSVSVERVRWIEPSWGHGDLLQPLMVRAALVVDLERD